jgi:hypothetical protein
MMNRDLLHSIAPSSEATLPLARRAATCFVRGKEDDSKVLTLRAAAAR